MEKVRVCKTIHSKGTLEKDFALAFFHMLKENVQWDEGIRSKKGFTRKAKALAPGDIPEVDYIITHVLEKLGKTNYLLLGIYLNYYENGNMWTPNHSHPGTHQLVISLGATRTLTVGKKDYKMENGDAIIFGSSIHGIPKEETVTEGRISIATFMKPF